MATGCQILAPKYGSSGRRRLRFASRATEGDNVASDGLVAVDAPVTADVCCTYVCAYGDAATQRVAESRGGDGRRSNVRAVSEPSERRSSGKCTPPRLVVVDGAYIVWSSSASVSRSSRVNAAVAPAVPRREGYESFVWAPRHGLRSDRPRPPLHPPPPPPPPGPLIRSPLDQLTQIRRLDRTGPVYGAFMACFFICRAAPPSKGRATAARRRGGDPPPGRPLDGS